MDFIENSGMFYDRYIHAGGSEAKMMESVRFYIKHIFILGKQLARG
jgi:hypothetical protein